MKKIALSLAALGAFAVQAAAVLDLRFTHPADSPVTLAPGASGLLSGTITGVTQDLNSFSFAPLTGFSFAIDSGFQAYLTASNPTTGYTGAIGTITALTTPGTYFSVGTVATSAGSTTPGSFDGENLQVNVTPEPASLAALGVGAVALLRRRRKA